MLTRLLGKRFGDVPDAVSARLQSAPAEQLEQWAERLLEVGTLDELFSVDATSWHSRRWNAADPHLRTAG